MNNLAHIFKNAPDNSLTLEFRVNHHSANNEADLNEIINSINEFYSNKDWIVNTNAKTQPDINSSTGLKHTYQVASFDRIKNSTKLEGYIIIVPARGYTKNTKQEGADYAETGTFKQFKRYFVNFAAGTKEGRTRDRDNYLNYVKR